jgi:hypothetical protein
MRMPRGAKDPRTMDPRTMDPAVEAGWTQLLAHTPQTEEAPRLTPTHLGPPIRAELAQVREYAQQQSGHLGLGQIAPAAVICPARRIAAAAVWQRRQPKPARAGRAVVAGGGCRGATIGRGGKGRGPAAAQRVSDVPQDANRREADVDEGFLGGKEQQHLQGALHLVLWHHGQQLAGVAKAGRRGEQRGRVGWQFGEQRMGGSLGCCRRHTWHVQGGSQSREACAQHTQHSSGAETNKGGTSSQRTCRWSPRSETQFRSSPRRPSSAPPPAAEAAAPTPR